MQFNVWRAAALSIGIAAASLGAYGAFEFQWKLEGGLNYLVIAAPFVAVISAIIPVMIEVTWNEGQRVKPLVWAIALVPAVLVVFLAVSERLHFSKAGQAAERSAINAAVDRAKSGLEAARASAQETKATADQWRSQRRCRETCQAKWADAVQNAHNRVQEADKRLTEIQARAIPESGLSAPVWLLPVALDLIAFVAIWTGLAPVKPKPKRKQSRRSSATTTRRRSKPAAPKDSAMILKLPARAANGN
jgi:hypothetical protein